MLNDSIKQMKFTVSLRKMVYNHHQELQFPWTHKKENDCDIIRIHIKFSSHLGSEINLQVVFAVIVDIQFEPQAFLGSRDH